MFVLGQGRKNWPTDSNAFIQYLLECFKEIYPEKAQSHIFAKSVARDPNAIDVDAAHKGKVDRDRRDSVYGLDHGRLHLKIPTCMWMNMGYWTVRNV